MFTDSELVFTCDKNNNYVGGGYVLRSEFMEGGAPPIINVSNSGGGNKPSRRKSTPGSSVSSLLFNHNGTLAVPAGLFLMNQGANSQPMSSTYDDSLIKRVLRGDGSSDDSSSSSSDSSSSSNSSGESSGERSSRRGGNRRQRHNESSASVVPETLYDTLFNMLSPDADKRRYWTNDAKTQRRAHRPQHQDRAKNNNNNNTRKKK